MKKAFAVSFFAAALLAGSLGAGNARAQSSKAAWRFAELVSLPAASASSTGAATNDTGWVSILTTHIKTPNGKELGMGVSLQCGLVTDTTVRSKNGDLDSSSARGRIRVRVKITQPDGSVVYGQPNNGADLATDISLDNSGGGLTYCDRYQKLEAKFSGLNCTADAVTGVVTCTDPEQLRLLLKTLDATHFNFIHANAMPGVQTVEVQARAQAGIALGGTQLGSAGAEAFAGAGALSVETIRLVKDADGTTDLTNLN
jgi:hypothetical protein